MAKVKGTHVVQLHLWLKKNTDPAELARLESDVRFEWITGTLVNLWYDMDDLLALLSEGAKLTGKSVREVTREVATQNALHDLRGVHRVFLKYNVTTWSLTLLPSLWRAYFDFGQPRVLVNERGRFQLATTISEKYVEWVIGGWEGFLHQMAVLTGATQVRLEVVVLPATPGASSRVVRSTLTYSAHLGDARLGDS
jgi:hypothetical protein